MTLKRHNKRSFATILPLIGLTFTLLTSCQTKPTDTLNTLTTDSVAPLDSIVSFEALFAAGKYDEFLSKHWTEECNNKSYEVAKALSMRLTCPCSGILPTIADNTLYISLNNINCYPPEVEEAGYVVDHNVTLPLETLRPYLNETGAKIVFESGTHLQEWLAKQKALALVKPESDYTLYVGMIRSGKLLRIILQSKDGPNNEEGTITGYFENDNGDKTPITGSRRWGGFIVYDPKNTSTSQIDFFWDNENQGDESHPVRNRYLSASSVNSDVSIYIDHVKLIGDFAQYEGPEDEYREPENGTPDSN